RAGWQHRQRDACSARGVRLCRCPGVGVSASGFVLLRTTIRGAARRLPLPRSLWVQPGTVRRGPLMQIGLAPRHRKAAKTPAPLRLNGTRLLPLLTLLLFLLGWEAVVRVGA